MRAPFGVRAPVVTAAARTLPAAVREDEFMPLPLRSVAVAAAALWFYFQNWSGVALKQVYVIHLLFALAINAKPADIPNELVVDISGLELGGSIHVSDIALPKGVSTDVEGDETVVTGTEAARDQTPDAGSEGGESGGDAAAAEGDGEG